jgi:hypothetical protein
MDGRCGVYGATDGIVSVSGCRDGAGGDGGELCGDVRDQRSSDVAGGGGRSKSVSGSGESEPGELDVDGIDRDGRNDKQLSRGEMPGNRLHQLYPDRNFHQHNLQRH